MRSAARAAERIEEDPGRQGWVRPGFACRDPSDGRGVGTRDGVTGAGQRTLLAFEVWPLPRSALLGVVLAWLGWVLLGSVDAAGEGTGVAGADAEGAGAGPRTRSQ
jgi:hypothetical protein